MEKTLVAKIAEACDAIGGVEKKGQNKEQGYAYQRATDVAKVFRHELFSRGCLLIPNEETPDYSEFITDYVEIDFVLGDMTFINTITAASTSRTGRKH